MAEDLISEINAQQPQPPKRKIVIIVSLVVVIGIILLITVAAIFLLRSSAGEQDLDQLRALLPGSETTSPSPLPSTPTSTPTNQPTPSATPTTTPATPTSGNNVAVTVRFSQTPSFQLSIEEVEKTAVQPTVQLYDPGNNAQYSILRIKDTQGTTIAEHRFRVGTQAIGEGFEQESVQMNVTESTVYLVTPTTITNGSIEILSPQGQLFDQQPFSFSLTFLERLKSFFRITDEALAQQNDAFTIVVINNDNSTADQVRLVASQVTSMVNSLPPWNEFAQQNKIQVISVQNVGPPVGCDAVNENGFPICRNDASVMEAVARTGVVSEWDSIVVISSNTCECGSVMLHFPPITAVGSGASVRLLAHELGHSVGKMTDEYGFQQGFSGPPGPNCFATQQACATATEPFPDAQCAAGCINGNTWRPASRIMFNVYQPLQYGPLEACILHNALASAVGDETDDRCITPESSTSDDDLYWGWRR